MPLLSFLALTGCSNNGDNSGSQDDGGSGDSLPYNKEQAKNKLLELGESSGFEIAYLTSDDSSDESVGYTLGIKNNITWHYSDSDKYAYKYADSALSVYEFDSDSNSFALSIHMQAMILKRCITLI